MSFHRPTGVSIIAILQAVGGLLMIVAGLGMGHLRGSDFVSLSIILIGGLGLFLCYGLWTLQNWARRLTLLFQSINILTGILQLSQGNGKVIWGLIISGWIIHYLVQPKVTTAFRN